MLAYVGCPVHSTCIFTTLTPCSSCNRLITSRANFVGSDTVFHVMSGHFVYELTHSSLGYKKYNR